VDKGIRWARRPELGPQLHEAQKEQVAARAVTSPVSTKGLLLPLAIGTDENAASIEVTQLLSRLESLHE